MRAAGGEAEAALAVLPPIPPPGLADELRLPSAGRSGLEREAGARLLAGPLGSTLPRAWSEGVWARWAEQLRGA